jgi:hypothetical protein
MRFQINNFRLSTPNSFLLIVFLLLGSCEQLSEKAEQTEFDLFTFFQNPPAEARPFVRWWWNGNRLQKKEIIRQLNVLHEPGIGGVNESTDDLTFSLVPYALVLFNPVVDAWEREYGYEKVKEREFEISSVHHISEGVPPTLIMHGKNDKTVPYENVVRFSHAMKQYGNRRVLKGYKKQEHGFFNYSRNPEHFEKTLRETESFLKTLNQMNGKGYVKRFIQHIEE